MLQDSAGEPLYKLFKAIKHQVEKGPVDAVQKKAKYTLNDTGLLGDDVEYTPLVSPRARRAVGSSRPGSVSGWVLGQCQDLSWVPFTSQCGSTCIQGRAQGYQVLSLALERGTECNDPKPAASWAPTHACYTPSMSVLSMCTHVRGGTWCVSCE